MCVCACVCVCVYAFFTKLYFKTRLRKSLIQRSVFACTFSASFSLKHSIDNNGNFCAYV